MSLLRLISELESVEDFGDVKAIQKEMKEEFDNLLYQLDALENHPIPEERLEGEIELAKRFLISRDEEIAWKNEKVSKFVSGIEKEKGETKSHYSISGGDLDLKTSESLPVAIMHAWNYEAQVFDKEGSLIFNGWLDDEEQNELLKPYGLKIIEYGKLRWLMNTNTGTVYIHSWSKNPFENNTSFKYEVVKEIEVGK